MGFFEELKNCFEGISAANKELVSDVKELAAESKRDIISDWKREAPVFGNPIEKVDRAITTYRNAKEHFPDPSLGPFNPDLQLKNIMKKLVQDNKLDSKIKRAQHLKVNRFGYSHHALSIDRCEVIHYQDFIVKTESIESFAKGADIHILDTPRLFTKDEVIARAYSKLGERKYNLIFNNCEHFVRWALNGEE
ncbi:lecithin retinol acyltransferase family protein [Lysinibacillus xylanilyticus]|uniref:Lecithin retinol acyltransferase family protein n=1 Tax=Lysinibacillus xylanilyticus TaxID=582475 RepID=A0ABT4EIJ6_9BACI|nr:lecithin retinol acyltransferase family protein [Lysinibacillus xylanilyticus]